MKIIHLEYRGPPALGGIETLVFELSKQLHLRGHEVEIWSTDLLDFSGHLDNEPLRIVEGVKVRKFRHTERFARFYNYLLYPLVYPSMPWCPSRPWKFFEENKDTIIHAYLHPAFHTYLALLGAYRFKKVVITPCMDVNSLNATFQTKKKTAYTVLKNFVNRKKNVWLTALTNIERAAYIKFGIKPEKIFTIPCGVNLEEFDAVTDSEIEALKARWKLCNCFCVLFAGRISYTKGVDVLIKAFAKFHRQDTKLVIMGPDFGATDALKKLTMKLNIQDKVIFTGQLDRKEFCTMMRAADVIILPSYSAEAFGIVSVEGMACCKPVIGSKTGGISEVIKSEKNGLLFGIGNVEQLAEHLERLYANKSLRIEMGKKGRELVEQNYTWQKIAEEYLKVYMW